MCPNSPGIMNLIKTYTYIETINDCLINVAPVHSMWSDGGGQTSTNFAANSGLDGGHCCVKVDLENIPEENSSNNSISIWRGENCQSVLKGICEFKITGMYCMFFIFSHIFTYIVLLFFRISR